MAASAKQVAGWVEEMGWEALVVPIPSHFVHMDGIVVPLAPKLAVACLDALEDWVIDWMRAKGFDFVDVGYKEAKSLGVTLVSLGDERVLSMKRSTILNGKLPALGFEVHAPDMSMYTLGGGGVHCLCQSLSRAPG